MALINMANLSLSMPFSQDLYLSALNFAARAHGEQKTPMGLPYIVHVSSVAMEMIAALRAEPGRDEDLALACALLHDVLEDTGMAPSELEAAFGRRAAAASLDGAKGFGLPR